MSPNTRPRTSASALHYDQHPYDVGVDGGQVYLSPESALGRFLASVSGGVALDVGCGPGHLLPLLTSRAARTIGVDASEVSLRMARSRCTDAAVRVLRADARALPAADASIHVVLASGCLHHTGDARAAFMELARVLVDGGSAFVSLYRAGSYYERLYRAVGPLARASARSRLGDLLVNKLLLLPPFALYFLGGRAITHRRISLPSYRHLANYFADQLLNPVVSFHSEAEVRRWAAAAGMEVVSVAVSHAGALLSISLKKGSSSV